MNFDVITNFSTGEFLDGHFHYFIHLTRIFFRQFPSSVNFRLTVACWRGVVCVSSSESKSECESIQFIKSFWTLSCPWHVYSGTLLTTMVVLRSAPNSSFVPRVSSSCPPRWTNRPADSSTLSLSISFPGLVFSRSDSSLFHSTCLPPLFPLLLCFPFVPSRLLSPHYLQPPHIMWFFLICWGRNTVDYLQILSYYHFATVGAPNMQKMSRSKYVQLEELG